MSDFVQYIETPKGKFLLKNARRAFAPYNLPTSHDSDVCLEDFQTLYEVIQVPAGDAKNDGAPSMLEAEAAFRRAEAAFRDQLPELPSIIDDDTGASAAGSLGKRSRQDAGAGTRASGSFQSEGISSGAATFAFGGAARKETSTGASMEDVPRSNGKAPVRRLGMTEADLARAHGVLDLAAPKTAIEFLEDKPLDVRMYTPLLADMHNGVRKVLDAVNTVAGEVFEFEGDFFELSPEAVDVLPTTPLFATCDVESGSRLLHRLETAHAAGAALRAKNLRCQRAFWLANHTPGCNWDTWEQLLHREAHDRGADLSNPCFVPLTTWEEQVKAAIIAARQESAALSKDGKTLLGPVLPRLQARHNGTRGKGNQEWRPKDTTGYRGGGKPFGDRQSGGRNSGQRPGGGRERRPHNRGKENARNKNAASPPAPKGGAKPASDP
jgi:hypothetical protein